jgi:hypothetical protein
LLRRDGKTLNWTGLPLAALKLQRVLVNAAEPLGLSETPSHSRIMGALVHWRPRAEFA